MNTESPLREIVFGNGTVRFSRDRLAWRGDGAVVLHARSVTETAPNGGIYVRIATAIEDELVDLALTAEPLDVDSWMAGFKYGLLGEGYVTSDESARLAYDRMIEAGRTAEEEK